MYVAMVTIRSLHLQQFIMKTGSFKDNHLANMAWWLKSAGALSF